MDRVFPFLGQTLGPYRLLQGLALGGMSAVFRACDERSQRQVAVKIPIEGALAGAAARSRCRREALALARIRHPAIPALLDSGCQDGIDYLVLELVEGPALTNVLSERGPLEEAAVLSLGFQISSALAAAHRCGVIHGDLKPRNVVLTRDHQVKLLDFGQAHFMDPHAHPGEGERRAGPEDAPQPLGALPYLAPELLLRRKPDGRADLWSLGVLLYEAATGERPFRGETPAEIVHAILHAPPAPPSTRNPRLSPRFDRIVLKALEKDPDRRYRSAVQMARALRRADVEEVDAIVAAELKHLDSDE